MSNKNDVQYNRMIAEYFSINPNEVDGVGNFSFWYYRRKLYEMVFSRFVFDNFPEQWDLDYFRDVLFQEGHISVCATPVGVLALRAGYYGINVYEKPTHMNISNPVLGSFNRRIGVNCEPVYFEYMNKGYTSMEQMIRRYAVLLAQLDGSLNVSLMNSRVAMAFTSTDKNVIKTMQKMYDDVTKGKPAVFALLDGDNDVKSQPYFNNVKQTYIGNDLLITKQTLINEFCTEIGLNNANTQKRERLVSDEVNANNEQTYTLIEMWIDNMNECFKRCQKLFPVITVRVRLRKTEVENTDKEEVENELS